MTIEAKILLYSTFAVFVLTCVLIHAINRRIRAERELARALDRLECWRGGCDGMHGVLMEFHDIKDSLELLREIGEGRRTNYGSVIQLRSRLRTIRELTKAPQTTFQERHND